MVRRDALIVGGGPAGSTCGRVLTRAGWKVGVIDRARFPRDKVCAGWITPPVVDVLELSPAEYRAAGLTIQEVTGFNTGLIRGPLVATTYGTVVSYAIRRCEFDDYLLRRAGVDVYDGTAVHTIRRRGDVWVLNDAFEAPVVIGAGGHFCPVARHLGAHAGRPPAVVARETEFAVGSRGSAIEPHTPELLFCRDLQGYAWCVRKGDYLNVGIGRRTSARFGAQARDFMAFLHDSGKVANASSQRWRGHAYLAHGTGPGPLVGDGMMLIGDAAGLAYPESGEGIRPAVESGQLAAMTLLAASEHYGRERLLLYDTTIRRLHPPSSQMPPATQSIVAAAGRLLLRSRYFSRHVMLDRWFLRRDTPRADAAAAVNAHVNA